ncbi:MAG: PAS domain S-box protein [Chloroflexi bacterium]|nr:PAS domain S-box protein [Chloroflexota bacterium]
MPKKTEFFKSRFKNCDAKKVEDSGTTKGIDSLEDCTGIKDRIATLTRALTEREKELNCIYSISKLTADKDISLEDVLEKTVNIIPSAWQYPEVTAARIILPEQEIKTPNFKETEWKESSDIVSQGRQIGTLEVCYLGKMPDSDEGPFLKEAREFINQIAEQLGLVIEHKKEMEALRQSQRELAIHNRIAQIFLTVPDDEMYGEVLAVILEAMQSKYGVFGYLDEDGALVVPSMTRHIWDKCRVAQKNIVFPRETWGNSTWPRAIRQKTTIYTNEPSKLVPEGHIPILRHISMPIVYREEAIGLLQVANKETDYDEHDIRSLQVISEHIATILDARLKRAIQEKQRRKAEVNLRNHQEQLAELVRQWTTQLQESEAKYRNLFNNAQVGLFRFRIADGKLLECNDLYARLIGYDSREECLASHNASEHYVAPNVRSKMLRELQENGEVRNFEAQVRQRRGSIIWVSDTARIYPREGYIEGAVSDITERKKLQEKLIASERLATMGQFSGSMAHELRNSLATISSSAYYLKSKLTGGDEKIQTHLERIKSSVDGTTSIIQSLLNLTRMKEPALAKLDLREIASGVTGSDVIPSTVRLVRNFPEQAVEINADREQLRMAFRNIVDNAVQAMEGKGTLTATVRNMPDGKAEVSFTDTGTGIPKENLEKIFEPLFSTKAKGIGFGLSIAKMVIDKHSGTIEAQSELGKGATLIIRLPGNLNK